MQCSGEAEYADDIPRVPGELTAALVLSTGWSNRILLLCFPASATFPVLILSTVGNCEIDSVDVDEARAVEGFVEWVDHNDIPGVNDCSRGRFGEEIFCSGEVHYAGQCIGAVLASSSEAASEAAKKGSESGSTLYAISDIYFIPFTMIDWQKKIARQLASSPI